MQSGRRQQSLYLASSETQSAINMNAMRLIRHKEKLAQCGDKIDTLSNAVQ